MGLVELLAALVIFGIVAVSAGRVMVEASREAALATRTAQARADRWETLRRLRSDVARADRVRLQAGDGVERLELSLRGRQVVWIASEGALLREDERGRRTLPVAVTARFAIEADRGRAFLRHELSDRAGRVEGRVLVGSEP